MKEEIKTGATSKFLEHDSLRNIVQPDVFRRVSQLVGLQVLLSLLLCYSCFFIFAKYQLPFSILSMDDYFLLRDPKYLLTDRLMTFASKMLKLQFPRIGGLYDTTALVSTGKSKPKYTPGPIVQLLFNGSNHWLTISNVHGQVTLYDSMGAHEFPKKLIPHVTTLFSKDGSFSSEEISLAQPGCLQEGVFDCGLFAIAIAELLCRGIDPQSVYFEQEEMRSHLFDCIFHFGLLSPFPLCSGKMSVKKRM